MSATATTRVWPWFEAMPTLVPFCRQLAAPELVMSTVPVVSPPQPARPAPRPAPRNVTESVRNSLRESFMIVPSLRARRLSGRDERGNFERSDPDGALDLGPARGHDARAAERLQHG